MQFRDAMRMAAPFVRAHRDAVFLLVLDPAATDGEGALEHLLDDLSLLHSLDVGMVLLAASRAEAGGGQTPPTEAQLLDEQQAFHQLFQRLSSGLAARDRGSRAHLVTGDWVGSQPLGVVDGRDGGLAGRFRNLAVWPLREALDGALVLLPRFAPSITGQAYLLPTPELAAQVGLALGADALVSLCAGWPEQGLPSTLDTEEVEARIGELAGASTAAAAAVEAARAGVPRVRLAPARPGALVEELYSREGSGCMLVGGELERIRPAQAEDAAGLLELLRPLEEDGTLVRRPRPLLEADLPHFLVVERDGGLIGCCALLPLQDGGAELAALTVHPAYRKGGRAEQLLHRAEAEAAAQGRTQLFTLTTTAEHWFLRHGFARVQVGKLPAERANLYNYSRASLVLHKDLGDA